MAEWGGMFEYDNLDLDGKIAYRKAAASGSILKDRKLEDLLELKAARHAMRPNTTFTRFFDNLGDGLHQIAGQQPFLLAIIIPISFVIATFVCLSPFYLLGKLFPPRRNNPRYKRTRKEE